jgi:hypothetical protein
VRVVVSPCPAYTRPVNAASASVTVYLPCRHERAHEHHVSSQRARLASTTYSRVSIAAASRAGPPFGPSGLRRAITDFAEEVIRCAAG